MRYEKLSLGLTLVCVLISMSDCFGQGCAGSLAAPSCGGRTPVRNLIAARPIRTAAEIVFQSVSTFQNNRCRILQRISSVRAASCAGSTKATPSCAGSAVTSAYSCSLAESQASFTRRTNDAFSSIEQNSARVTPVRSFISNTYQQALASAQYRAANKIHGHSYLDTHRTSGVGWTTSNSSPNTCLGGDNGSTYAVAQGADGWYATKF